MIPSLSRFGASLPAYSTRPAFTPTTENSKALGVSSRANTQRQGFSIFTFLPIAFATGKKRYEVGFIANQVEMTLDKAFRGGSIRVPINIPLSSRTQPEEIVPYLKKNFESVFPNTADPLTVLQGWLKGKVGKRTAPVGEETLRVYIEECEFYADLLGNPAKLKEWEKYMNKKIQDESPLTPTEQIRWDSYNMWKSHEYYDSITSDQKRARGQLFTNLISRLKALLTPVLAK